MPEDQYQVQDTNAFLVMRAGMCAGWCVELSPERWAAVCTSSERYLVGVYDTHRLAYDAVCAAEKENMT